MGSSFLSVFAARREELLMMKSLAPEARSSRHASIAHGYARTPS